MEHVTNVYVGAKTEVWMAEGGTLDKESLTATLAKMNLKLGTIEKAEKSAL